MRALYNLYFLSQMCSCPILTIYGVVLSMSRKCFILYGIAADCIIWILNVILMGMYAEVF